MHWILQEAFKMIETHLVTLEIKSEVLSKHPMMDLQVILDLMSYFIHITKVVIKPFG